MANECATALHKAMGEFPGIGLNATNPHFRNAYASLDHIIDRVRPVLLENGLVLTHRVHAGEAVGELMVEAVLTHAKSGDTMTSGAFPLVMDKKNAQGAGSAMTYGRRYTTCALLCLAPAGEDDDGNVASQPAAKPQREAPSGNVQTKTKKALAKWTGLKDRDDLRAAWKDAGIVAAGFDFDDTNEAHVKKLLAFIEEQAGKGVDFTDAVKGK